MTLIVMDICAIMGLPPHDTVSNFNVKEATVHKDFDLGGKETKSYSLFLKFTLSPILKSDVTDKEHIDFLTF